MIHKLQTYRPDRTNISSWPPDEFARNTLGAFGTWRSCRAVDSVPPVAAGSSGWTGGSRSASETARTGYDLQIGATVANGINDTLNGE